jgi:hypothetical protein
VTIGVDTVGYQLIEPSSLTPPIAAHHAAYSTVLWWFIERLQRELSDRLDGVRLCVITANYVGEYPVIAAHYSRDVDNVAPMIEKQVDEWVHSSALGDFLNYLCSSAQPHHDVLPKETASLQAPPITIHQLDFHDSRVVSFCHQGEVVVLRLEQWDGRIVDIEFQDVVLVRALILHEVEQAHHFRDSKEIDHANTYLVALGAEPRFYPDVQHLQLWNDGPAFDVVFGSVSVTVIGYPPAVPTTESQ